MGVINDKHGKTIACDSLRNFECIFCARVSKRTIPNREAAPYSRLEVVNFDSSIKQMPMISMTRPWHVIACAILNAFLAPECRKEQYLTEKQLLYVVV